MIGVLRVAAWCVLATALGLACLASLVDRLAGSGVLVAAPALLSGGGNVSLARAEQAWREGDLSGAAALAAHGLARRPIDGTALRLAGAIALARREDARGQALMRLAGAAGWRDRPTQVYWAQAALEQQAFDVAGERIEALERLGETAMARPLLYRLEATSAGRGALIRRWNGVDPWLSGELARWPVDDASAMANRQALVRLLLPRLIESDRVAIAVSLVDSGRIDPAFDLLRPDERVLRFGMAALGPLGWQSSASQGVDVTVEGGTMRVQASGPALLPLATRLVRLPVGRTRLTLRIEGARTDLPVIATLDCLGGRSAGAEAISGLTAFDLVVPSNCPAQWLRLAVAGDEARRGADLRLHPPTLSRAAAAP